MKKIFFLSALLCASLMAWATPAVYTGTPFSGNLNTYTYNIAYTVTYNDDYSLTFTAEFTGTSKSVTPAVATTVSAAHVVALSASSATI